MEDDRKKRIEERAYGLWEQAGRPEGGADEFWHQAEREEDGGKEEGGNSRDMPGIGDEASAAGFAEDLTPGDAGDARPAPPAKGRSRKSPGKDVAG